VLIGGQVVERLDAVTADRMLRDGAFDGGIVPKLLAAVRVARLGVHAEIGATRVAA
jgi:acetylglutamate kinase